MAVIAEDDVTVGEQEFSKRSQSGPLAIITDVISGFQMQEVWRAFAWDETLARYHRSFFGLAWIIISYLMFVGVIALFFGSFSSASSSEFLAYVALGYAAFVFLNGNVIDGCAVFTNSASWIKSTPLPYSVYVYKAISRSLTPFILELCVAFIIMVFIGWRPTLMALWVIPAFVAYLSFSLWAMYLLGLIAARQRDIGLLLSSLSRLLFFTTPIMFTYETARPVVKQITNFNPFTHYVKILRDPLLFGTVPVDSWIFVIALTIVGGVVLTVVGGMMRSRLPYWV
ncbi:MAG: ABC transporter permease [Pseudomonadota bacterium]